MSRAVKMLVQSVKGKEVEFLFALFLGAAAGRIRPAGLDVDGIQISIRFPSGVTLTTSPGDPREIEGEPGVPGTKALG